MDESNIFKLIRTIELFTNETIIRWTKAFQPNLGISSILVLAELRDKGEQKQSSLSNGLGYTPGAMTNIANKLIKEGYAERKYNQDDRRLVLLVITDKGISVLNEARQTGEALRKELFSVLSEAEIAQLLVIHEKLLKGLGK
ncbi:DNA-binding MarR family transcriptional regulator [Virgibacillus halotolerans]|uniref:MarR family winged helix-turn-helix transcriptional regulator n=1 Tax=Virgibacillus halotolerans TaxID=1071053 RepID=UPI00195F5441|nr:MarR family transcriptional regulator [Virgibacillus halotolerans]MBM7600848.1 DNA-binding MarR family transcriptional regulator [Virgibacillus halotolerans]